MTDEPIARTAGEQDHSDPWTAFAGDEDQDPPGHSEDWLAYQPNPDDPAEPITIPQFTTSGSWRNCGASEALIAAINAINPQRSRASDGTIGDLAHKKRASDHNPNAAGVVRARDITRDGLDLPKLFEHLRQLGRAGDPRLAGGGYLILDRRITAPDFSGWRAYSGSNPHIKHGHVSFSRNPAGYDSRAPWNLTGGVPDRGAPSPPAPSEPNVLKVGSKGAAVERLQARLEIAVDGVFGTGTERAVKQFQAENDLVVDGLVGPATWAMLEEETTMATPQKIFDHHVPNAWGSDQAVKHILAITEQRVANCEAALKNLTQEIPRLITLMDQLSRK